MRTSKARIAFVALLGLAFLAAVNLALTLVLVPYGSKSELVWTDYAKQDEIDTVMVGSSVMQYAIDPYALDEACGTRSFCLATPDQTLEESFIGLQTAYEDHQVKRAILSVTMEGLVRADAPSLGGAFLTQRSRVVGAPRALGAAWQVLFRYGGATQTDSVNALFPWIFNHVRLTATNVKNNVSARLHRDVYGASKVMDPHFKYSGKGYGTVKRVVDCNSGKVTPLFSGSYVDDDGQPLTAIDPGRLRTLGDISAYCDERGIDLVVIYVPLPDFDVADGDGYYEVHDEAKEALAGLGRELYDFNYARPELFESHPDYFFDRQHLNGTGSKAFTESFAEFLSKRVAGEDVSSLFYETDEKRGAVDHIAAVFADASIEGQAVHVTARAAAGSNVEAEYRLCTYDSKKKLATPVSEWSAEPDFAYEPPKRGTVRLRVYARQAGESGDGDCYRNVKVYF